MGLPALAVYFDAGSTRLLENRTPQTLLKALPAGLLHLLDTVAHEGDQAGLAVYVVGGFVRDMLLGRITADVDLVIEGDAIAFAQRLAKQYGGSIEPHADFGTATWTPIAEGSPPFIDLVTARRESYIRPGALPSVQPSSIEDDLHRRDFSINAMAIQLAPTFGTLLDPFGGANDLEAKLIRVLHPGSFNDDATRIFRAMRFEQRFDFHIAPDTLALIAPALPTLATISGERLRHELDLIFVEAEPERAMCRLEKLGILQAIYPGLKFDEWQESAFRALRTQSIPLIWSFDSLDSVARTELFWIIWGCRFADVSDFAHSLMLSAHLAGILLDTQRLISTVIHLSSDMLPSEVVSQLEGNEYSPLAMLVAWLATPDVPRREIIEHFAAQWRLVRQTLTGDDLKSRGLEPGPRFKVLLWELRRAWLDGVVSTPEQERAYLDQLLGKDAHDDRH